jgi:hypothetical protein
LETPLEYTAPYLRTRRLYPIRRILSRELTRPLKTRSNTRWPPHQRLMRTMSCRFRSRNSRPAESKSSGFNTRPPSRSDFTHRSMGFMAGQDSVRDFNLQDQNGAIVIPVKVRISRLLTAIETEHAYKKRRNICLTDRPYES